MEVVIDSSLALAWALPDETSAQAERVLGRLTARDILWVPALWWYEIANALLMAERRRHIREADRLALVQLYERVPIQTDAHLNATTIRHIQSLAVSHHLSPYDAAYLELASRKSVPLATLDKRLLHALEQMGLESVS
jgi:predicted nucleic acid-binding protein